MKARRERERESVKGGVVLKEAWARRQGCYICSESGHQTLSVGRRKTKRFDDVKTLFSLCNRAVCWHTKEVLLKVLSVALQSGDESPPLSGYRFGERGLGMSDDHTIVHVKCGVNCGSVYANYRTSTYDR